MPQAGAGTATARAVHGNRQHKKVGDGKCRECIVESLSHFGSADRMCCCFNGEPGLYPQVGGNFDTTVSQLLSASTYSASLLKWSQTQHPTVPEACALRDWPPSYNYLTRLLQRALSCFSEARLMLLT
jgi:hypothetical protein